MDSDPTAAASGWPFRLGVAGLAESAGVRRVEESMRIILGTQHGERVMRPDLRLQPHEPGLRAQQRRHREPRPLLRRGGPDALGAAHRARRRHRRERQPPRPLLITVTYRLRATSDTHVFVYPFSLERPQ